MPSFPPGYLRNATAAFAEARRRSAPEQRAAATAAETGGVKYYNREKGFGFIAVAGGADAYVHHSTLPADLRLRC